MFTLLHRPVVTLFPDLASYIYLFAPMQLVVLNPFAYFLLEWHQSKQRAPVPGGDSVVGDSGRQSLCCSSMCPVGVKRVFQVRSGRPPLMIEGGYLFNIVAVDFVPFI